MRRPQISIAGLALVILVVGVGLAAIRSGSDAWAGAMFSIMAFVMICSLMGVVLTRGARRVYWSGFAVLGWSYLILMYVPWLYEHVGQFLLATPMFQAIEQVLHPEGDGASLTPAGLLSQRLYGGGGMSGGSVTDLLAIQRIGLALEALLWAYLGGWVARYFASGRVPESPASPTAAEPTRDAVQRDDAPGP